MDELEKYIAIQKGSKERCANRVCFSLENSARALQSNKKAGSMRDQSWNSAFDIPLGIERVSYMQMRCYVKSEICHLYRHRYRR